MRRPEETFDEWYKRELKEIEKIGAELNEDT